MLKGVTEDVSEGTDMDQHQKIWRGAALCLSATLLGSGTAGAATYHGAATIAPGITISGIAYTPGKFIAGLHRQQPSRGARKLGKDLLESSQNGASSTTTGGRVRQAAEPRAFTTDYIYSKKTPRFEKGNADGEFGGQATYGRRNYLAWGWSFSHLVRVTALSDVKENANLWNEQTNRRLGWYHDDHDQPASEKFHSSIPVSVNLLCEVVIDFRWDCYGPEGPGTCTLTVDHYFSSLQAEGNLELRQLGS